MIVLVAPALCFSALIAAPQEATQSEWRHLERLVLDLEDPLGGGAHVEFGGRAAAFLTKYDPDNAKDNGLSLPILRPLVEGNAYGNDFRMELDLVGVDSKRHAFDVWVARDLPRNWRIQIGQIRVAMASEYSTRQENFPLHGYSFTTSLTGRYDLGFRAEAGFFEDQIGVEGVAAAGSGFGLEGEGKGDPLFLARGTLQPFRNDGPELLRGAFVGLATAYQPEFTDEIRVITPTESVVFVMPDLDADRAAWFAFECGWHQGPFRLGFEQVRGIIDNVEVPGGGHKDMDELWGWTLYGSVFFFGGKPEWKRGAWRIPTWEQDARPLEIAARYSNGDIDRDFFNFGVTTYDPSSQENRTLTIEATWYPLPGFRTGAGWVNTLADDNLSTFGGSNRDSTVFVRLEANF